MPTGTPFHPRTEPLCHSHAWRHWSGYVVATSYNDFVQPEYAAIRHAAALIDVSPLYKYRIEGPDAEALIDRVITHDAAAMEPGRIVYTPWCDPDGAVRQEGTVFRLGERAFMLCSAEPTFAWLQLTPAAWRSPSPTAAPSWPGCRSRGRRRGRSSPGWRAARRSSRSPSSTGARARSPASR
jgi:glycine cleavage system aminomethyltransferase T